LTSKTEWHTCTFALCVCTYMLQSHLALFAALGWAGLLGNDINNRSVYVGVVKFTPLQVLCVSS
jgi:hypothetical protein